MNGKLTLKVIILMSVFFVGALKPGNKFYPTTQIAPSFFYSEKLIEYKIRELQLLLKYAPYLQQVNQAGYFNTPPFSEQFNLSSLSSDRTETVGPSRRSFFAKLGSGLNSISMPFRRGIGKEFENLTSKVAHKGITLGIGCLVYWAIWGKRNNLDLPFYKRFFLPVTTAFNLIKKFFIEEKVKVGEGEEITSISGKIDIAWNKISSWFFRKSIVDADLQTGAIAQQVETKVGLGGKTVALASLVLANFLF